MKPTHFKESTTIKQNQKIEGQSEGLKIPVMETDGQFISLWTCSIWERLKFLFNGRIWIGIAGKEFPPVWVELDGKKDKK